MQRKSCERIKISEWLAREGFKSKDYERIVGIHRQTMTAIKRGRDLRLSTSVKLLEGTRKLAKRRVGIEELVDLDA